MVDMEPIDYTKYPTQADRDSQTAAHDQRIRDEIQTFIETLSESVINSDR
jgi:hypothetical protein